MTRADSINWLSFICNVWVAHIHAPRKTNEHEVLGELYKSQFDYLDTLTELSIARGGETRFPDMSANIYDGMPLKQLLQSGLAVIAASGEGLDEKADADMLNVLADARGDIMRAAFKLELTLSGKR